MCIFVYFRWGCKHEESARQAYEKLHRLTHTDLTLESAGFKISSQHPFIGATPDGYVTCSCCGSGVIEIKCPHCVKDMSLDDAASTIKRFCLIKDSDGNLKLDRDHMYYYQVQMQLFVADKAYCDVIIWAENDSQTPYVERIAPDAVFFQEALAKVELFLKCCIIPELLAKFYTVPKPIVSFNDGQKYCYCKEPASGQMLECSSGFCTTKKFHKDCLKLKRVVSRWVCPCCRKIINKQKRDNKTKQK